MLLHFRPLFFVVGYTDVKIDNATRIEHVVFSKELYYVHFNSILLPHLNSPNDNNNKKRKKTNLAFLAICTGRKKKRNARAQEKRSLGSVMNLGRDPLAKEETSLPLRFPPYRPFGPLLIKTPAPTSAATQRRVTPNIAPRSAGWPPASPVSTFMPCITFCRRLDRDSWPFFYPPPPPLFTC